MIRKAYVDTTEGQMHYRYTTEGSGPPLVFFHMTAASSKAYEGIMEQLDGRFPLIAFDTMNYGESYRTTRKPEMSYIADVMLEALRNMGVETFHTYGHHTGVSIQLEMAVRAPDRVLSTILNGATHATPAEMAMFMEKLAQPNPISLKGNQFIWAWSRAKDNMQLNPWTDIPHAVEILDRETVDMLRAGTNWHWAYQAVFAHDLPATLAKVTCPVFFVSGAKDLSHPLHAVAIAKYPHYPSHVYDDGGVFYVETHPELLAPHVAQFVEGINQGQ